MVRLIRRISTNSRVKRGKWGGVVDQIVDGSAKSMEDAAAAG